MSIVVNTTAGITVNTKTEKGSVRVIKTDGGHEVYVNTSGVLVGITTNEATHNVVVLTPEALYKVDVRTGLVGPQGAQGPIGDTGPVGPQGPTGPPGSGGGSDEDAFLYALIF